MPRPALFVDRDGVLNEEIAYCHRPEDFIVRAGAFDLLRAAREAGHAVIVVTNQSGLARGLFDDGAYERLTAYMKALFAAQGAGLDDVLHCPYHPAGVVARYRADHPWRKPRPGMLLAAAARHDLDLPRSRLVGDRRTDIAAAAAAGLSEACIVGGKPGSVAPPHVARVPDVTSAAAWLRDRLARDRWAIRPPPSDAKSAHPLGAIRRASERP